MEDSTYYPKPGDHVLVDQDHNVPLGPRKAYIGFPEVALLGQRVDALGMTTPEEKVCAIASLEFPRTCRLAIGEVGFGLALVDQYV